MFVCLLPCILTRGQHRSWAGWGASGWLGAESRDSLWGGSREARGPPSDSLTRPWTSNVSDSKDFLAVWGGSPPAVSPPPSGAQQPVLSHIFLVHSELQSKPSLPCAVSRQVACTTVLGTVGPPWDPRALPSADLGCGGSGVGPHGPRSSYPGGLAAGVRKPDGGSVHEKLPGSVTHHGLSGSLGEKRAFKLCPVSLSSF